jgi:hypothetical protein
MDKESTEPFCEFCGHELDRNGKKGTYLKMIVLEGDFSGSRPRKGVFESHSIHKSCYKDFGRPFLMVKVFKFATPIMEEDDKKPEVKPIQREYIPAKEILVCPSCGGELTKQEGCMTCKKCGWSKCS